MKRANCCKNVYNNDASVEFLWLSIGKWAFFLKNLYVSSKISVKNIFYLSTLILTYSSAVNMRAQYQANASLISVLVVIFCQNDRSVNAVTIKPKVYQKALVILM